MKDIETNHDELNSIKCQHDETEHDEMSHDEMIQYRADENEFFLNSSQKKAQIMFIKVKKIC